MDPTTPTTSIRTSPSPVSASEHKRRLRNAQQWLLENPIKTTRAATIIFKLNSESTLQEYSLHLSKYIFQIVPSNFVEDRDKLSPRTGSE